MDSFELAAGIGWNYRITYSHLQDPIVSIGFLISIDVSSQNIIPLGVQFVFSH